MEAGLSLFFGRRNNTGASVAVCLEPDAVTVAAIRLSSGGRPGLSFAERVQLEEERPRKAVLEELLRRGTLQGRLCNAIVPLGSYQTMMLDLSDVSIEEGRQAARWQIGDRVDYPPEQAIIDLYQTAPFGGDKRPQSYAVTARKQGLRTQVDEVAAAGLRLAAIDIPEFALRNICELFVDDPRGVALLLLLDQTGLLVVVREGILYLSRQLSIGMDSLLACRPDDAGTLINQFDSIVLDIQRSFDFCESSFQLPLVSRLLVAQTRQELPALVSHLDDYLSTTVEPLRLDAVMDLPSEADQLVLNQQLPAIGGALRREAS